MDENNVKPGSPKAWLLAARPKTLAGAAVPVMIGSCLAFATYGGVRPLPVVLCFLFAFFMQIDANFVNDYFDCVKGTDTDDRLGPKRACAQGWISLPEMRVGIVLTTLVSCLVGLPLIVYGGLDMIFVGAACVLFCFLYTTCLSYWGLGDLLVLLFFGIVPVCLTCYLAAPVNNSFPSLAVVWSSLACGLIIDTLLIVNNYRDIDNDRLAGKHTLVVRIGRKATEWLYLALGIVACVGNIVVFGWLCGNYLATLPQLFYLVLHVTTYREMCRIGHGKELNRVLGKTARNIFVYGLTVSLGLILTALNR